jgi:hypothetical protein
MDTDTLSALCADREFREIIFVAKNVLLINLNEIALG